MTALTLTDPCQTAQDLRVAANVITHAGFGEGIEIDPRTGSVCLLGAIGVATQAIKISLDRHFRDRVTLRRRPQFMPEALDSPDESLMMIRAGNQRSQDAIKALAFLLPEDPWNPDYHRIYNFNDHECREAEDAITILIQAAEKLEADL